MCELLGTLCQVGGWAGQRSGRALRQLGVSTARDFEIDTLQLRSELAEMSVNWRSNSNLCEELKSERVHMLSENLALRSEQEEALATEAQMRDDNLKLRSEREAALAMEVQMRDASLYLEKMLGPGSAFEMKAAELQDENLRLKSALAEGSEAKVFLSEINVLRAELIEDSKEMAEMDIGGL